MEHWEDYMDFTLMEREDKCIQCGKYTEHFITGGYEVGVKTNDDQWATWQWSYDTPRTEVKEIEREIEIAILDISR